MHKKMKRFIPFIMVGTLGFLGSPVKADIMHRLTSSVQLQTDAGFTQVSRAGNTYSTSGSGVSTTITPSGGSAASDLGGISAVSTAGVATFAVPDVAQTTQGQAYTFTQSITTGDSIVTTAPDTGDVLAYSNQASTAAGDKTGLAGTILTNGAMTLTAGGAGTNATGQFVTELSIR
tara:strand:- start:564 stop:1091 length:528 start_codon:yes stop_codon:yes gene_type:complete